MSHRFASLAGVEPVHFAKRLRMKLNGPTPLFTGHELRVTNDEEKTATEFQLE